MPAAQHTYTDVCMYSMYVHVGVMVRASLAESRGALLGGTFGGRRNKAKQIFVTASLEIRRTIMRH